MEDSLFNRRQVLTGSVIAALGALWLPTKLAIDGCSEILDLGTLFLVSCPHRCPHRPRKVILSERDRI